MCGQCERYSRRNNDTESNCHNRVTYPNPARTSKHISHLQPNADAFT